MLMLVPPGGPMPFPLRMSLAGNDVAVFGTWVSVRGTIEAEFCAGA